MWQRPVTIRALGATLTAVAATALIPSGHAAATPDTFRPGDMIRLALVEFGCTVGITGHLHTGTPVAITAGHCAPTPTGPAYPGLSTTPAGTISTVTDYDNLDVAVVHVHGHVPDSPIATPGDIGDIVCKIGRVSGRTCGPIVEITTDEIIAKLAVVFGDSGGPLLNSNGQIIGLTSRLHAPDEPTPAQSAHAWGRQLSGTGKVRFPRADQISRKIGLR